MSCLKTSKRKITLIFVTIFVIASCGESQAPRRRATSPAVTSSTDTPPNSSETALGTGSGGGGYDNYAKRIIEDARVFLIKALNASSSELFKDMPEGFNKVHLIHILSQNIHFVDEERTRDGDALLFDYDAEKMALIVTERFVEKYNPLEKTNNGKSDLQLLEEISTRLLHELSHLMGIGQSKKLDVVSGFFAQSFLAEILSQTSLCHITHNNLTGTIALQPSTGLSFYFPEKNENELKIAMIQPMVVQQNSQKLIEWQLGTPFPFFQMHGAIGNIALENVTYKQPQATQFSNKVGDPIFLYEASANEFQPDQTTKLAIWPEYSKEQYRYSFKRNSFDDNGNSTIKTIRLNLTTNWSDANSEQLEETFSINSKEIPLNCSSYAQKYPWQKVIDLGTATSKTEEELLQDLDLLVKEIHNQRINTFFQCNDSLSEAFPLCEAAKIIYGQ